MEGTQTHGASGPKLSASDAQLLEVRVKAALMIRLSIIGAVVCMLVVLGVIASSSGLPESPADRDALALACALLGIGGLTVGYLVPRFAPVVRSSESQPPGSTASPSAEQMLAALTSRSISRRRSSRSSALLGFVLAFVAVRPLVYLPFFAVSLAALATTIPKKDAWEQEIVDAMHPGIPQSLS